MLSQLNLPVSLTTSKSVVTLRRGEMSDLDALVRLLSGDAVSASRGDVAGLADVGAYGEALTQIVEDASNEIVVAVDESERAVGTLQLTRIPGMTRRGSTRLLVEAVRVANDDRSTGIGSAMMRWVTETAAPSVGAGLGRVSQMIDGWFASVGACLVLLY